jgi:hypothetical protein
MAGVNSRVVKEMVAGFRARNLKRMMRSRKIEVRECEVRAMRLFASSAGGRRLRSRTLRSLSVEVMEISGSMN